MSASLGRIVRWGGLGVSLASLGFLARRAWMARTSFSVAAGHWIVPEVVAASLLASAGCLGLIFAWRLLLSYHGGSRLGFAEAFKLYAGTQIAKYIPGNVFQYASRQAEGWRCGIAQGAMALTSLGEAAGLCCTAAALALAGLTWSGEIPALAGLTGAAACAAAFPFSQASLRHLAKWFPKLAPTVPEPGRKIEWAAMAKAFLGQTFFFVMSATTFSLCALPWGKAAAGNMLAASTMAWLAGFVTPGAPAGLGVREAILAIALEGSFGRSGALAAAALFRVAWTASDMMLYLTSLAIRRKRGELPC